MYTLCLRKDSNHFFIIIDGKVLFFKLFLLVNSKLSNISSFSTIESLADAFIRYDGFLNDSVPESVIELGNFENVTELLENFSEYLV